MFAAAFLPNKCAANDRPGMARTGVVPDKDTARETDLVVVPGTSWRESGVVAAPGKSWICRIDTVPGTTRGRWTSTDAVPGVGTNDGFTETFRFAQIIDDGEDEDDEEDSHDPVPKTVHFGFIEEAESENDHTSMMAGKTRY